MSTEHCVVPESHKRETSPLTLTLPDELSVRSLADLAVLGNRYIERPIVASSNSGGTAEQVSFWRNAVPASSCPYNRWSIVVRWVAYAVCHQPKCLRRPNERACARFLDMQHQALIDKVRGLSDQDVRTATVSALSLLSLIKHSAIWERRWFQVIAAGRLLPEEPTAAADGDTQVPKPPKVASIASEVDRGPRHRGRPPSGSQERRDGTSATFSTTINRAFRWSRLGLDPLRSEGSGSSVGT